MAHNFNYNVEKTQLKFAFNYKKKVGGTMKFIKGLIIGSAVSAGIAMLYTESMNKSGRRMIRRGRKIAKKIGVL